MSMGADKPGAVLTATLLAISSLTVMANATISPSLPGLARAFSETEGIETLAGLVLTVPSLAIVLTAALFGIAADRLGRRSLLVAVLLLYAIGGAAGAIAATMPQILLSRIVLGVGVAGTLTIATLVISDLWSGADRQRVLGWQSAAMGGGGILFVTIGGLLAEFSWRAPFLIYLSALPLAVMAFWVVPRPGQAPAADGAGLPDSAAMDRPMVVRVAGMALFLMAMFYLVPTRLPFLLNEIGVTSPTAAGMAIAAMTAASVPASLVYGRIARRLAPLAIFALAFLLMAGGYATIASADSLWIVIAGTVLAGSGLGMSMPNLGAWLMARMPPAQRGRASGILTTAIFAGQFVSPLLSGVAAASMGLAAIFALFAGLLGAMSAGLAVVVLLSGQARAQN